MAVKAVELVRRIRDKHHLKTKGLSAEEQIKFIREKSIKLQKKLKGQRSTTDNKVHV